MITIILALLALESIVRVTKIAPVFYWVDVSSKYSSYIPSSDPELGYVLKKNEVRKEYNLHESFPKTNNIGFRDHDRKLAKTKRRILLVGDSVVAGHGIEEIKNLIGPKLESKLICEDIEIISLGLGGYNFYGGIKLIEKIGMSLHPDHIIHLIVNNDLKPVNTMIHTVNLMGSSQIFKHFLIHSALLRTIVVAITSLSKEVLPFYDNIVGHQDAMAANSIKSSSRFIKDKLIQNKIGYHQVLWPDFQEKIYSISKNKKLRTGILKLIEKINKDQLLDLAPYFPQSDSPRTQYTIGDGMHPNEKGADFAAEIMSNQLIKKIYTNITCY